MSIKIDKEFQNLIPPLSAEEYTQLEKNCVHDGIRDPIVVWGVPNGDDIIIDGHNRWNISAHHGGIRFNIVKMHFDNREQVKEWIIKNQLGRRNIPAYVRAELALLLKPAIQEKAKEQQANHTEQGYQKSDKAVHTAKEIAKAAGVSHDTIHKVEKIQEKASEEAKAALRRGEASINQVYSGIMAEEHKDRRKQEAEELSQAKKRVETYQGADGKIANFEAAKQNKDDTALIFQEFQDTVRKTHMSVLQLSITMNNEATMAALKAANKQELIKTEGQLQELYRTVLKIQRMIVEVLDEK